MSHREALLEEFRSWQPTAPSLAATSRRGVRLEWLQPRFPDLRDQLLYRLERHTKLPAWSVAYSGGKTSKSVDDLPPGHPHRFRLKVILKGSALQRLGTDLGLTAAPEEAPPLPTQQTGNVRWLESRWSEETWASTEGAGASAACFCLAVGCGYLKQIFLRARELCELNESESEYMLSTVPAMCAERPELLELASASSGLSPLATAATKGDASAAKLLLSLGAAVDGGGGGGGGRTPLLLAVLGGHLELALLLLQHGADMQARDCCGLGVEHCAVDSGSLEMLRLVLDRGGRVDAVDDNGWTPLFRALCEGASTELLRELVARGSDLRVVDGAGLPLASAARLLGDGRGRSRDSVVRLVDPNYPHEKALANFTRITKKIYNVQTLFKST